MNFYRLILSATLVLALAGCGGLGKSNLEPPTPLKDFKATAQIQRLWSADIGDAGDQYNRLAPRLAGDTVYAASGKGDVTAFNADTGKTLWRQELAVPVSGAMGYGNNLALLGTREGEVLALNSDSGKLVWRTRVSSEVLAPPVATSGVVVVQTIDGFVYGLSAQDGKRLWQFQRTVPALSLRGTSGPSIQSGMVVTGFADGTIVGLDLNSGKVRWDAAVARPSGRTELERLVDVDGTPVIAGYRMFAASYQGRLIALDLRNGRLLWGRKASTYVPMAVDRSNVYLVDADGVVVALDQATGAERWRQTGLRARFVSAPAIINGYLAAGDYNGVLHLLSRDSGEFVARTDIDGSAIVSRPVSRGNRLYVSNQSGRLVAMQVQPK
ncbi:MAG: outer membrane protein assembly factor BamB [Acidiferrobacterales bacterium]|jgi:outer membrane protein assembly factor BamB|nr:outer membrane protein assembly factor BamB [Acidiferrobacterales bacterium]